MYSTVPHLQQGHLHVFHCATSSAGSSTCIPLCHIFSRVIYMYMYSTVPHLQQGHLHVFHCATSSAGSSTCIPLCHIFSRVIYMYSTVPHLQQGHLHVHVFHCATHLTSPPGPGHREAVEGVSPDGRTERERQSRGTHQRLQEGQDPEKGEIVIIGYAVV